MKTVGLLALLASTLSLSPPTPPAAVPIDQEPSHQKKFENDYVRVFDVVVPPRGETLYHVHSHDYVFVSFGAARVRSEPLGARPIDLTLSDGEARFVSGPVTHRAVNLAETPFHNLTVEILKSAGAPAEAPLPAMPGHSIVLENDRIRIDRQVLEPGQSTGPHTHTLSSLGICVSRARVEYSEAGEKAVVADLETGQFNWHSGTRTHSLRNVGKTRFEAIEIEWK